MRNLDNQYFVHFSTQLVGAIHAIRMFRLFEFLYNVVPSWNGTRVVYG